MSHSRHLALAALLAALGSLTAGCGANTKDESATTDGVGGSTHWLSKCKADSECGSDLCYVGVCTAACVRASQCGEESSAQCVTGVTLPVEKDGMMCKTDSSVCLSPCSSEAQCGSGLTCSDGFCVGSRAGCESVGDVTNVIAPDASVVDPDAGPSATETASMNTPDAGPSASDTLTPVTSDTLTPVTSDTAPPFASSTSPAPEASASAKPVELRSPRSLVDNQGAPYPVDIAVYAPEGYCDSNTVDGLSSTLTILDADSTSYRLSLLAGEQDCEFSCSKRGRPEGYATLVQPELYTLAGFALESEAAPCTLDVDAGSAPTCLPRHAVPWGTYTVQFCAYLGELAFPEGTTDILCDHTSDEPVCVSDRLYYPDEFALGLYLALPEAP